MIEQRWAMRAQFEHQLLSSMGGTSIARVEHIRTGINIVERWHIHPGERRVIVKRHRRSSGYWDTNMDAELDLYRVAQRILTPGLPEIVYAGSDAVAMEELTHLDGTPSRELLTETFEQAKVTVQGLAVKSGLMLPQTYTVAALHKQLLVLAESIPRGHQGSILRRLVDSAVENLKVRRGDFRHDYGVVHGELSQEHVLAKRSGLWVVIDWATVGFGVKSYDYCGGFLTAAIDPCDLKAMEDANAHDTYGGSEYMDRFRVMSLIRALMNAMECNARLQSGVVDVNGVLIDASALARMHTELALVRCSELR